MTTDQKAAEAGRILDDLRDAGFPHPWAEEELCVGRVHSAWRTARSAELLARLRIESETGSSALGTPLLDPHRPFAPFLRQDPENTP